MPRPVPHLLVEVGLGELQRVQQSVGGRQLDVVAGLLLPHALDDGGQDLVGVLLQLLWFLEKEPRQSDIMNVSSVITVTALKVNHLHERALTHDVLADVSDGLQRGFLHVLGAGRVRDVGHQLRDQLGPLVDRDLGAGDPGDALRCRAGPVRLGSQSL